MIGKTDWIAGRIGNEGKMEKKTVFCCSDHGDRGGGEGEEGVGRGGAEEGDLASGRDWS